MGYFKNMFFLSRFCDHLSPHCCPVIPLPSYTLHPPGQGRLCWQKVSASGWKGLVTKIGHRRKILLDRCVGTEWPRGLRLSQNHNQHLKFGKFSTNRFWVFGIQISRVSSVSCNAKFPSLGYKVGCVRIVTSHQCYSHLFCESSNW